MIYDSLTFWKSSLATLFAFLLILSRFSFYPMPYIYFPSSNTTKCQYSLKYIIAWWKSWYKNLSILKGWSILKKNTLLFIFFKIVEACLWRLKFFSISSHIEIRSHLVPYFFFFVTISSCGSSSLWELIDTSFLFFLTLEIASIEAQSSICNFHFSV